MIYISVHSTYADFFKALPLLVFFWVPIVGYLTPAIIILAPSLLPYSFMTTKQQVPHSLSFSSFQGCPIYQSENYQKSRFSLHRQRNGEEKPRKIQISCRQGKNISIVAIVTAIRPLLGNLKILKL
jgi:hypothetical protein